MTTAIKTTVGQFVVDRPARSRVFERLGIDFCCGGKQTLEEACRQKGLDVNVVLEALQANDDQPATARSEDVANMSATELCDHIEQTHHAYVRSELPRLGAMVHKVASVHGQRHPWLVEVERVFAALESELSTHMLKEEQILFPWIRAMEGDESDSASCRGGSVANPIRVMEHEHDDAGRALSRLRELTSGYTPQPWACNTCRAMLDGLNQFEDDLHQHIHKENNILFPKAMDMESRIRPSGLSVN